MESSPWLRIKRDHDEKKRSKSHKFSVTVIITKTNIVKREEASAD